jgi:hypothetical protein
MSRSVRGPDYSLRVFEKHPHTDAYKIGGAYEPYAIVATEKRFTDAELAAEYWLLSSRAERMNAYDDGPGSETRKMALLDRERMNIIHRFSTLPSYDD